MNRYIGSIVYVMLVILSSCTSPKQQPDSIKAIVLQQKEANEIELFLVLSNELGESITGSGRVFTYINGWSDSGKYDKLWIDDRNISEANFKTYKLNIAGQENEVLAYSYGKIPYSSFKKSPAKLSKVDIWVTINSNGRDLKIESSSAIN